MVTHVCVCVSISSDVSDRHTHTQRECWPFPCEKAWFSGEGGGLQLSASEIHVAHRESCVRCRANIAFIKKSRPDPGLVSKAVVLNTVLVFPTSLGSGLAARPACMHHRPARPPTEGDLISPQLYRLVYLLIVDREGLVTSCLSLSLASLSRLSLTPEPKPQRHRGECAGAGPRAVDRSGQVVTQLEALGPSQEVYRA